MTPVTTYRAPRTIAVSPAAVLTVLALGALVLQPLLGSVAAAGFLAFGLALVLSAPNRSLHEVITWWPLLLLPAYCLLSTIWSRFPDLTLRYSIQLAASLTIAVLIGVRVPAATLLRGLFVLYSVGAILCLLVGRNSDGVAWLGIFASKNALAAFVSIHALICVAMICDPNARTGMRLVATAGALLSGVVLIRAQSAGASAMIIPAVLTILAVVFNQWLSSGQRLFAIIALALGMAVVGLVLWTFGDVLLADFLEFSGKDTTLTGRTDLWEVGLGFIAERPWLGLGYRAFWVPGNAPAEDLWAMFGQVSGAGFSFHNLYISNAVDLGLLGLGIEVVIIYGTAALLVWLAIIRPNHLTGFFLGMQILLILRSLVEVEVFFEFSMRSILVYCGCIYAVREFLAWRPVTRSPARSHAWGT